MTHGAHIQVWKTPNHLAREFAPFNLHRTYTGHHGDVLSIQWSPDSEYVLEHPNFLDLLLLTLLQNFYDYLSRYDCPSTHTESVRRFPTKNFRCSSRCCVGCLFLNRWYIGQWQGSCSLIHLFLRAIAKHGMYESSFFFLGRYFICYLNIF